jgi:S-adenosylmethionine:tRNA ribosyltransferase-isomerase
MPEVHNISIQEFTYNLPDDKIAKYPLEERANSKLLIWNNGIISDSEFCNISKSIPEKSLLVFNNTKVIRARLQFRKKTGARIEIFCLEPYNPEEYTTSFAQKEECSWKCIVGNLKKWKGEVLESGIEIGGDKVTFKAERRGALAEAHEILFSWDNNKYTFSEILDASGSIPIPPYLNRESEKEDLTRYQTVYSKIKGSVAAPTAGLHFTEAVFSSLKEKNIEKAELTLHVGAGTFKPVKSDTIGEHDMHTEHIIVNREFIKKLLEHPHKVIAVGTTSVRTLESLYWIGKKVYENQKIEPSKLAVTQWEPYKKENCPTTKTALKSLLDYMDNNNLETLSSSTRIIILPGYDFKIINGMFTNFHQPQSTLLLLVSAFIGEDWRKVYDHALNNDYRFLSYGDSNLYIKS